MNISRSSIMQDIKGGEKLKLEEIVRMLQQNLLLGLVATAIICLILFISYRYIYVRKFSKGHRVSRKKMFLFTLLILYITSVCALTLLSRGANYNGIVNLALFSSYREAWYTFSLRNWEYIYFNILMFVPFGILLPLLFKRFTSLPWMLLAAIIFTGFIESIQYITGTGIFELDDLFNNLLGACIGFGIVKACMNKRWYTRLLATLPLLLVIVLSAAMLLYYDQKEFGNLASTPVSKAHMKEANVSTETSFDSTSHVANVYKAPRLTKEEAKQKAYAFFKEMNIDTSSIEIIDYQNEALYRYNGEEAYSIYIYYLNGSYSTYNYSELEASLMDTTEETLRSELKKMAITIPEQAQFKRMDKGQYKWFLHQFATDHQLIDGTLTLDYTTNHAIQSIENNLTYYEKVKEVSIKSEKQAYDELQSGQFNVYDRNIKDLHVKKITLDYELDSKGFYQPVYTFNVILNGEKTTLTIAAID